MKLKQIKSCMRIKQATTNTNNFYPRVKNISNVNFIDKELYLLSKGLKYAPKLPTTILLTTYDLTNLAACTEEASAMINPITIPF